MMLLSSPAAAQKSVVVGRFRGARSRDAGDLDLFVVDYVDADRRSNPFCGNAKLGTFYCHALNAPVPKHLQPPFVEIGRTAGPGFALEKVGRGLATGDDKDGDLDLLVTSNGQSADLLRNYADAPTPCSCARSDGRRIATRARIRVIAGGKSQLCDIRAGSSYLGRTICASISGSVTRRRSSGSR
jgi:hypothetical protein